MKKFWDVIKSHKKISIVVLLVLVICLVSGGVFLARGSKKTPVMATDSSVSKESTIKSDSKLEDKTSEDLEDSKAEEGQKSESQESETAKDSASADASNQASASSSGFVDSSSNAGAVSDSDTKKAGNTKSSSTTTKNTTSNNGAKTSANSGSSPKASFSSSSASAPKANTSSPSNASSQSKTSTPSQSTQPSQPAQPAKPTGHYETKQVLVTAAYDEPIYETQVVGAKCNTCGQVFKTSDEWAEHSKDMAFNHNDYTHGSYSGVYGQVQVGTKHHDAVYKTEQVWVQD